MTPAIHTAGLGKTYGLASLGAGRTVALHPLSLTIPHGSIYALLGHNGAGKTTLLKLLMNILHPSAGTATILGVPASTLTAEAFTRIGYVSENQELPGWMTVRAFLQYQSGFYPTWDDAALIRRFQLPLSRKLKNLSRGQRMKVALASVLAFQPSLIVLDEPFSGLDPLVRDELIEALLDAAALKATPARDGAPPTDPLTILLSSHDLAEIESFSTHVAFLDNGHLLFAEEMSALSARFREVTVTLPQMQSTVIARVRTAEQRQAEQALAPGFPPTWLLPQISAHTLRFIHTQADTEPIAAQVQALFPSATDITLEPMPLRAIFLAIAKSGRSLDAESTPEGSR